MDSLEVIAGSRLHFGLLCAPQNSAWHYGGIGVMIDRPNWKFCISKADTDSIHASPAVSTRIQHVLNTLRQSYEIPAVAIHTTAEVVPHTGLGSGTQLALAVGSGLSMLAGISRPNNSIQLATLLNRNRRSGIGTFGFDNGGFIVDRGRNAAAADQLQRISFPDDWRFVLLTPGQDEGLSGKTEETFFGEQAFLDPETVAQLERLIEQQIVVAIVNEDFPAFAASIETYGQLAGEYYSKAQGGIFSNQLLSNVVVCLAQQGITGAAQSSWGPTVCIPAASEQSAEAIVAAVIGLNLAQPINASISRPLNSGATIRSVAPEDQRSFG